MNTPNDDIIRPVNGRAILGLGCAAWVVVILIGMAVFAVARANAGELPRSGASVAYDVAARINRQVNHAHTYGTPYPADTSDGVWDCENYAFAKRDLLGGLALFVTDERGLGHMVLEVQTERGLMVLDSKYPWPMSRVALERFGYSFAMAASRAAWWERGLAHEQ